MHHHINRNARIMLTRIARISIWTSIVAGVILALAAYICAVFWTFGLIPPRPVIILLATASLIPVLVTVAAMIVCAAGSTLDDRRSPSEKTAER